MKNIILILGLIVFLGCSNTITKTKYVFIKSDSPIIHQEIPIPDITRIINNSEANVFVKIGDEDKLVIECDSGLQDYFMPYISEKKLVFPEINTVNTLSLNYYLTVKDLEFLQINGMGNVLIDGLLETNELEIIINGSGDLITDKVDILNLSALINGSGDIKINGEVNDCKIQINGSGDFYGIDFTANYVSINSEGSGDVYLEAKKEFRALLEGSGDIHLEGHPEYFHSVKRGSGNIREEK